jgi:uncharacterized membrane protein HdeD (DUF308 family)
MAIPRWVGPLLIVVGILGLIAGIIYLAVPAHALPSFYPGHLAGSNTHHDKRGTAGTLAGVILLVVGGILTFGKGAAKA